jgi:hypothetical protein
MIQEATRAVDRWKRDYNAAPRGSTAYRTAKSNLHTARGSLEGWKEYKEDYEDKKAEFAS